MEGNETKLSRLFESSNEQINLLLSTGKQESLLIEDIARILQSTLQEIVKLLLELQLDALCGLATSSALEQTIDLFYGLHSKFFLDLGDGLAAPLVYSLLLTHNVVGILTERSTHIQEYIVNSGSLFQNFFELEEMKKTLSGDQIAHKFIVGNLMILYSCSSQLGFHCYFNRLDAVYFFSPFCKSPQFDIRFHSKFTAGRLVPYIPSMSCEILELDSQDIKTITEILGKASSSDTFEVHIYNCVFSTEELLSGMRSILHAESNKEGLLEEGLLTILVGLLIGGSFLVKKEACLVVWDLIHSNYFTNALKSLDLPLFDVLSEIESSDDCDFKLLVTGLISSLQSNGSQLVCPQGCYKYSCYNDCINQCDKILHENSERHYTDSQIELALLLKAKSLYHFYRQEELYLSSSMLEDREKRQLLEACNEKARKAITSLDKVSFDEEASFMLDVALCEYGKATNRLKDVRKCILCRKTAPLLRSHICPHSILKEFCAASTTPENLRVFDTSSREIGHSVSPREFTMYAFCKSCENMLSTYGEQDFITKFFRKVYAKSDHEDERYIEYGPWLYHFCIGMIFRALMITKFGRFFNSDELYKLFLLCRKIILDPSFVSSSSDLPNVYILLGPHKASEKDQHYGFINQVLNSPYLSTVQDSSLQDGTTKPPYFAHYLLVHIGIIHIITVFSPSKPFILPPEYQINPMQGVYTAPSEEERGIGFPLGLWTFLRLFALKSSSEWLERPLAPLERMQKGKMIKPQPELESVFHIASSVKEDLSVFETNIVPSPDPNYPRIISLLPPGFEFRPQSNPSSIVLPKNHSIIFHLPKGEKEVFFLAIGCGGAFDLTKPYIIYSHCEPGLEFSCGFFIDPVSLAFQNFLPFREGKVLLDQLAIINEIKTSIDVTLSKLLKSKGVANLSEILSIVKITGGFRLDNYDRKCFGKDYCWYCVNRCTLCLQLTGSNYSKLTNLGKVLRFCGRECYDKLGCVSPFQTSLKRTSVECHDGIQNTVGLEICGTGFSPTKGQLFQVNLKLCCHNTHSNPPVIDTAGMSVVAFYCCRSTHLQTMQELCVKEENSQIILSSMKESCDQMVAEYTDITTLLRKAIFVYTQQENLSLHDVVSLFLSLTSNAMNTKHVLDEFSTVRLSIPSLKVTLTDVKSLSKPENQESSLAENNSPNTPLVYREIFPLSLNLTENEFEQLLELLPPECAIAVEFSKMIAPVDVCNKSVPAIVLPVVAFESICVLLMDRANDIFKVSINDQISVNESTYEALLQLFIKVEKCINEMPMIARGRVGDMVARLDSLTSTISNFFHVLYTGLNSGLTSSASQCFLVVGTVMGSLLECSIKLRDVLLSSTDIVSQLVFQLKGLRHVLQVDQFIKELIIMTLHLVSSLTMATTHQWQFFDADIPNVIAPYCASSLRNVSIQAKTAISPLYLEMNDKESLLLEVSDEFLSNLSLAEPTNRVNVFNTTLSIVAMLNYIKSLIGFPLTSKPIVAQFRKLLEILSCILQWGDDFIIEMKLVVSLLWKLAQEGHSSSVLSNSELLAQLVSLTGLPSLEAITSCVLWKLNDGELQDLPLCYIEECYAEGYFNECVHICNALADSGQSQDMSYQLLYKAKSLFQIYRNELKKLSRRCFPPKLHRERHASCLAKTKEAILCLGSLLDQFNLDEEGSKMLDLCMIDYIYETNDLQSCRRCLLCRQKKKLLKSHIWPRSILERFGSGVEMPKTHRTLLISWQPENRYCSPKEVTFFMFCSSCESLFSSHGESQFIPNFFGQIYDTSSPGKTMEAISVTYGKWLYEFCMGILFRGLAQRNMFKFENADEIYSVLTQCRHFLLNSSKGDQSDTSVSSSLLPEIYIVIGPTEAEGQDSESGFINRVLNMPALYGVEEFQLKDGIVVIPRKAHFFIAHFGLINILTKFKPSLSYSFPDHCEIKMFGGTFLVPKNNLRKSLIPIGVWNLFLCLAQDFEVNWLTRSTEAVERYSKPEKKEARSEAEETFGFVSATKKDFEALNLQLRPPLPHLHNFKIISFLPKQFKIERLEHQSCITLPSSHQILIHYLIPLNNGIEETLFLCVGSDHDSVYSYNKPYIIYHYFNPDSLQLSVGFFINPDDLTALQFLPETSEKFQVDTFIPVAMFRENVHKLLPSIMSEKGFCSTSSFLLKLQKRENSLSVDTKCRTPTRCWYCLDRCECCLQRTGFGCVRVTDGPMPLYFCSSCQNIYLVKKTQLETKVHLVNAENPLVPAAVSPLSHSHQALLHIHCEATISGGMPLLMQATLCSGKESTDLPLESPYIVYHHWTIFHQTFLEFTISPDLYPDSPVPYTEGSASQTAITDLRNGPIRQILVQALKLSGYETIDDLILNLKIKG